MQTGVKALTGMYSLSNVTTKEEAVRQAGSVRVSTTVSLSHQEVGKTFENSLSSGRRSDFWDKMFPLRSRLVQNSREPTLFSS